jgi:hypothetical protein
MKFMALHHSFFLQLSAGNGSTISVQVIAIIA